MCSLGHPRGRAQARSPGVCIETALHQHACSTAVMMRRINQLRMQLPQHVPTCRQHSRLSRCTGSLRYSCLGHCVARVMCAALAAHLCHAARLLDLTLSPAAARRPCATSQWTYVSGRNRPISDRRPRSCAQRWYTEHESRTDAELWKSSSHAAITLRGASNWYQHVLKS